MCISTYMCACDGRARVLCMCADMRCPAKCSWVHARRRFYEKRPSTVNGKPRYRFILNAKQTGS